MDIRKLESYELAVLRAARFIGRKGSRSQCWRKRHEKRWARYDAWAASDAGRAQLELVQLEDIEKVFQRVRPP